MTFVQRQLPAIERVFPRLVLLDIGKRLAPGKNVRLENGGRNQNRIDVFNVQISLILHGGQGISHKGQHAYQVQTGPVIRSLQGSPAVSDHDSHAPCKTNDQKTCEIGVSNPWGYP